MYQSLLGIKDIGKDIGNVSKNRKSYHHPAYFSFWPVTKVEKDFERICVEDKEVYEDKRSRYKLDQKWKKCIFIKVGCTEICFMREFTQSKKWSNDTQSKCRPISIEFFWVWPSDIKERKYWWYRNHPQDKKWSSEDSCPQKHDTHFIKIRVVYILVSGIVWYFIDIWSKKEKSYNPKETHDKTNSIFKRIDIWRKCHKKESSKCEWDDLEEV